MSNPWRETKGYSFHSICLHVRDLTESCMFYEEVFGMSVVRESDLGSVRKAWLQFPANKGGDGFALATSLLELVQRKGTEFEASYDVQANAGGFHHISFSVPDLVAARSRFERLGVTMDNVGVPHTQLIVVRDPDHYPIQLISQDFDLHAKLHDVCRDIVVEGAEQSLEDIRCAMDPETMEEAGIALNNYMTVPTARAPSSTPC